MSDLLMPKATAVWLIDNTALTFEQIAAFCSLHELEVQAIADGESGVGIQGYNPIQNDRLTKEEIERCEGDSTARLVQSVSDLPDPVSHTKGPRYVPILRRGDKPDAIAWILKNHPNITDNQICKLVGTTKQTIGKIRDRTHANMVNINAQHPVFLGLCKQDELDAAIEASGGESGGDAGATTEQAGTLPEMP